MAQQAIVRGVVFNEQQVPQSGVNITWSGGGTQTDESGFYTLSIPAEKTIQLNFSHIAYKAIKAQFNLKENEMVEFNPILNAKVEQISDVVITANTTDQISGITNLTPETVRKIPGANPGVENLLQALPGVSSNNELSTQYAVRGGNYDENLVYINDIEVYRPFLIRSGQQEGLSIINPDLVRDISNPRTSRFAGSVRMG